MTITDTVSKNMENIPGIQMTLNTCSIIDVIELIHKTYRIKAHSTLTQLLMELGFSTLLTLWFSSLVQTQRNNSSLTAHYWPFVLNKRDEKHCQINSTVLP